MNYDVSKFRTGLTFDDVLLVPQYSDILPSETNIRTRLSRNIYLNTPILSAAMDTVTEAGVAIAMAQEGGLGIIHKNMSVAEQAHEVALVKRAQAGMIARPVVIRVGASVGDAIAVMKEKGISG